jgi:hypothetical protein
MSKITRGIALAGACLTALAVAAPANSQSLKLGGVSVTRASAQAPIAVNAPVRVLSPGRNGGGASSTAKAESTGAGTSAQAPIAVNAPVRVLSPGRNGGGASSKSETRGNRGASVQAPIAVNAPIRVLSPGDDTARAGGPGDEGDGGNPSPGGPTVEAPVDVNAPIRIVSPGNDGGGAGGGEAGAEAGSKETIAGDNSAGGGLGVSVGGAECPEVQTMSAVGVAGRPLFGAASILLLALLGTAFVALRSTGRLPFARWVP